MQQNIIFSFLLLLTDRRLKDPSGSQAGSCHDSDNCEKDGEGGHQGAGAVPRSPGIHRVAVVGGAPQLVNMDTATSRCLLFMNLSAEARVCDAATAVPGGNNQIRCNGGACSCHIYITPDCVHPTCSPFGSALNTLRVLGLPCNTLALET